jgi:hypothetical protein
MDMPPIQPFFCYVEYNEWPAGLFTPYDGAMAAGTAANEDALIAALEAAITKAKVPS